MGWRNVYNYFCSVVWKKKKMRSLRLQMFGFKTIFQLTFSTYGFILHFLGKSGYVLLQLFHIVEQMILSFWNTLYFFALLVLPTTCLIWEEEEKRDLIFLLLPLLCTVYYALFSIVFNIPSIDGTSQFFLAVH